MSARHTVRAAQLLGPLSPTSAMLRCTCGLALSVPRGERTRAVMADHRRRMVLAAASVNEARKVTSGRQRQPARPPATVSSITTARRFMSWAEFMKLCHERPLPASVLTDVKAAEEAVRALDDLERSGLWR